jgi:hypothetical protein
MFTATRVYENFFCEAESHSYTQECTVKLQFAETETHLNYNTAVNTQFGLYIIRVVFLTKLVRERDTLYFQLVFVLNSSTYIKKIIYNSLHFFASEAPPLCFI